MNKIEEELSISTLKSLVRDLKRHNKIIGFTHGAFDLFHSGHLYLLKEASKACDFLLVGLEKDENISKYKSIKRPILTAHDRLEIVNNINCVGNAFILYNKEVVNSEYEKIYTDLGIDKLIVGSNFMAMDKLQRRSEKLGFSLKIVDEVLPTKTTFIIDRVLDKYKETK